MQSLKSLLNKTVNPATKPFSRDTADSIEQILKHFPQQNGILCVSDARFFQHEEEDYDTQYQIDGTNTSIGSGVVRLLKAFNCDLNGLAVEVGCGTGIVSRGLLVGEHFGLTVISDPSPKFVEITQRRLKDIPELDQKARFAILMADDIGRFPANSLSAIIMRSVLHHILDVQAFLSEASKVLAPGGILVVEEPCSEGFILMGTIAQFIPKVLENHGQQLTPLQKQQVQTFVDTMKFYVNRKADKSQCEDKHVFRVDQLIKDAEQVGLKTEFFPNVDFAYFNNEQAKFSASEVAGLPVSFSQFFYTYLKYCMSFDQGLLDMISKHFLSYCTYIDEIATNGNPPYSSGTFLLQKSQ
jgi:ubiquinone/menaquinone biosynthesis C-methylase UbiE